MRFSAPPASTIRRHAFLRSGWLASTLLLASLFAACAGGESESELQELELLELLVGDDVPLEEVAAEGTAAPEATSPGPSADADGFARLLAERLARDEGGMARREDEIVGQSELALQHSLALAHAMLSGDAGAASAPKRTTSDAGVP